MVVNIALCGKRSARLFTESMNNDFEMCFSHFSNILKKRCSKSLKNIQADFVCLPLHTSWCWSVSADRDICADLFEPASSATSIFRVRRHSPYVPWRSRPPNLNIDRSLCGGSGDEAVEGRWITVARQVLVTELHLRKQQGTINMPLNCIWKVAKQALKCRRKLPTVFKTFQKGIQINSKVSKDQEA